MKNITLSLLFLLMLTACQKEQPDPKVDQQVVQQFDQADNTLDDYLNVLDAPKTSKEQSKKIICEDYPKVYKDEYTPALLKLAENYTEQELRKEMNITLNYYKQKLDVDCSQ